MRPIPHAELLQLLADGNIISGEQLGEKLGISRNAVWKQLEKLRQLGLNIKAISGRGYQLDTPLELLDQQTILHKLNLPGKLFIHPLTASTNAVLGALPPARQHGSVVLAEYQSAGRGRLGRRWVSPFGRNIYLSLGWQFEHGVNRLAGLSLLAGLAVVNALAELSISGMALKWPNDILCGRSGQFAKLGGCLVEINGDVTGPSRAIIGIGLNLRLADDIAIDQSWCDLREHPELSRNQLINAIIQQLLSSLPDFSESGFEPFINAWNRHHAYKGQRVAISGSQNVIYGRAQGVDAQGALLLDTENGQQRIHSGELSLRKL